MPDPVFLITGVSSGIGDATARRASETGFRLVLGARLVDVDVDVDVNEILVTPTAQPT